MVPGYDQRQARIGLTGLTKPDPKDRAAQIIAWAICWPWNLVWTICVYNPFRYVAEFLLKEIQSALFEIQQWPVQLHRTGPHARSTTAAVPTSYTTATAI